MIFASAVSQLEFFEALLQKDLPWHKITAFHMDEYHTLDDKAPQKFGHFLKKHLFDKASFGVVHYLSDADKYKPLIAEAPIDIVCLGIGENGHLAFNDPPVADFNDPDLIKIVELDEMSRQQQVNDGAFETIEEVPKIAVSLTIPALLSGNMLSVVVPGKAKSQAVRNTLFGNISTDCPASILRTHHNAKLFLDPHSSECSLKEIL
jgi:glucosamine-6-phosphate deaminase